MTKILILEYVERKEIKENEQTNKYDNWQSSKVTFVICYSANVRNYFKQSFIIVDRIIVGHLIGANAFASIGATGSVSMVFTSLCLGIAIGLGIVISQFFGANDETGTALAIRNGTIICIISTLIVSVFALLITKPILLLLNTPVSLLEDAVNYMSVSLGGLIFVIIYYIPFSILRSFGHHKTIKCLIASGIEGIGRKAYARDVLKTSEIMEKYYFPFSISLSQSDDITDLINKICDLGVGDYTITDIISLKTLDERIDVLTDLLIQLQQLHEYLFIDDDFCLIKSTGLAFWLEKALEKVQSSIVLVITTRIRIDFYKYNKSKNLFCIALNELSQSECSGLLRGYSKMQGMPFQLEDIEFFSNILTGYPPQIRYCVDLAISEGSIQYVKDNSYKIADYPKANSAKIINAVIDNEYQSEYKGFLALLSYMDTVPITLINYIIKKNSIYKSILNNLKLYSLCKYTGNSGEYIKLNAVISDYIQRSDFTLSDEIENILKENIDVFYNNMNNSTYLDYLSLSEFVYYVKENLKSGKELPDKFLYSTIYVKSVI